MKTIVDIKTLKTLREQSGVSYDLCRKALLQSGNDIKKAEEKLSQWGIEASKKKAGRQTEQGAIFCYVHHNSKVAAMIELFCETDFVASNDDFKQLGRKLAMQCASDDPSDIQAFLKLPFLIDQTKTVDTVIKELILKIGENIKIGKFVRFEL